jgi:hypothetical protein
MCADVVIRASGHLGLWKSVLRASAHLQYLQQVRADEVAAAVQLVRVTLWGSPRSAVPSIHHVAPAPILLDQLGDAVAPLALAPSAFHPQHVELTLQIAEGHVGAHRQCLPSATYQAANAATAAAVAEIAAPIDETSMYRERRR